MLIVCEQSISNSKMATAIKTLIFCLLYSAKLCDAFFDFLPTSSGLQNETSNVGFVPVEFKIDVAKDVTNVAINVTDDFDVVSFDLNTDLLHDRAKTDLSSDPDPGRNKDQDPVKDPIFKLDLNPVKIRSNPASNIK